MSLRKRRQRITSEFGPESIASRLPRGGALKPEGLLEPVSAQVLQHYCSTANMGGTAGYARPMSYMGRAFCIFISKKLLIKGEI